MRALRYGAKSVQKGTKSLCVIEGNVNVELYQDLLEGNLICEFGGKRQQGSRITKRRQKPQRYSQNILVKVCGICDKRN